jgi:hypothetical protein
MLWIPSIAPTGLMFYNGRSIPVLERNLFGGSARRGEVPRTGGLERVVITDKMEELRRETLLTELHQRIRDVRQGPDGLIYVVTDEDDGALLRLEPGAIGLVFPRFPGKGFNDVAVASNARDLEVPQSFDEIAFGFVHSQAFLSAQELGVFDALGNESLTLEARPARSVSARSHVGGW